VLDTFEKIKVCTAYKMGDQKLTRFPASAEAWESIQPVYETLDGWMSKTQGMTNENELPEAAQALIKKIESHTGSAVHMVSTGPDRNENIVIQHPFD
jgi:adenylosuccinate synthase